MTAEELEVELKRLGLTILAVASSYDDPARVTVFLHGNSGQWFEGQALRKIKAVPGVTNAIESDLTPAIIRVELEPS